MLFSYENQLFRAYGAPTAADRDFHNKPKKTSHPPQTQIPAFMVRTARVILTGSGKSPAGVAKSNRQWMGTYFSCFLQIRNLDFS